MSMNVGAIMRALLGDGQPADSRALELKVGQIVRGVLLEMLDEGEAVIQINGVHVRARLDTELPVGKGTLLQVQQPAAGGEIVLKALADPAELPPDETMKDVVKSFGLPEQKWSFELLRGLKRDGYPIDKMTAAWFRQAAETLPAGADPQEWMNAAGVAFRRGLEPTETTIASLRQTLYGPPVGERLDQLQAQLTAYLERPGDSSEQTKALAARALQLLAQGNALLAQGGEQLSAPPRSAVPAAGPQPAPQSAGEGLKPADARMAAGRDESAAAGEESRAPFAPAGKDAGVSRPAGALAEADIPGSDGGKSRLGGPVGAPGERGAYPAGGVAAEPGAAAEAPALRPGADSQASAQAKPSALPPQPTPEAPAPPPAAPNAAGERASAAGAREAAPSSGAASREDAAALNTGGTAAGAGAAPQRQEAAWIGRFLQWLGVEHERQAMQLPGEPAAHGGRTADAGDGVGAESARAGDSLKGALLALASSDDLPPALREAAQGMAQQITGQQLLLSSERQNMALMSHMTLFVPMKGPNGDTTATIHVQTRRGRKGEWDADNCRLLFDLRMSHLGDTVVDVHVVDKVVSLKLLNDRPWVAELVDAAKDEAVSGLRAAGYQLLSLKTAPFPAPANDAETAGAASSAPTASLGPLDRIGSAADAYAAKPYKGVDYRA